MNAVAPTAPQQRLSIVNTVAARYGMMPDTFEKTVIATCVQGDITKEQFWACLVVANEYKLNPLTREIYFFPGKGGKVVPMVGVDGWARIINDHPGFDGMEFDTEFGDDKKPFSVTCRMYRKDRVRPIAVTEYMSECARPTDPWKTAPARMLRHKAMIQAARYAFGFSGIYDEDDAAMIRADIDVRPTSRVDTPIDMPATPRAPTPPAAPQTDRRPPSPPKPSSPPPIIDNDPPADGTDWTTELTSYSDQLASVEDNNALAEAIEIFGARFADAPDDVRAEATKTEGAERARIKRAAL